MRRFLGLALLTLFVLWGGACTRTAPVERTPSNTKETVASVSSVSTLEPSHTPPPTATVIPSPTPTSTPSPTTGPTPTPTIPVLPTSDPRYGLNLSAPSYRDDFSSHLTWGGPNFEGAVNYTKDGEYLAVDQVSDTYFWWSTTKPDIDGGNVYVEISAQFDECNGKDSLGLALRVGGELRNNGYAFEISCDGAYRLLKLNTGLTATLIDWSTSESLQPGAGKINRIGFLANGNNLTLFANEQILDSTSDDSFFMGNYGLYSNAVLTPGLTARFDDFALWFLN